MGKLVLRWNILSWEGAIPKLQVQNFELRRHPKVPYSIQHMPYFAQNLWQLCANYGDTSSGCSAFRICFTMIFTPLSWFLSKIWHVLDGIWYFGMPSYHHAKFCTCRGRDGAFSTQDVSPEHKLAHDVYLEYACLECSRQCVFWETASSCAPGSPLTVWAQTLTTTLLLSMCL